MALNYKGSKTRSYRTNERITASEIRVISSTGEQLGILSIREALIRAEDEGFDLVEVSPDTKPPVCKIVDYGKLYQSVHSGYEFLCQIKTITVKRNIITFDENISYKYKTKKTKA